MRRRLRFVLWGILTVAVLLRVANYAVVADGALLYCGQHSDSDLTFFGEWGHTVAEGDLWTDRALHPLHRWHQEVAGRYLEQHPERTGGVPIGEFSDEQILGHYRDLWNDWYGGKRFHQEPLYPYLLATLEAVCGSAWVPLHLLQMSLGVLTILLLYTVTRRCFGCGAGLASAGLATLCGVFLFFELFTLRATAITFATVLLVDLAQRAGRAPSVRSFAVLGLAVGVLATLKLTLAAIGLAGAAVVLCRTRQALPRRIVALLGAALVGFAPVLVRNALVGAPLFSSSSVAAVTFAGTNHAQYHGSMWLVHYPAMVDILGKTKGELGPTVSVTLGTHASWGSYLSLLWTKWWTIWHWPELPNNINWYFGRQLSPFLAWLPVTFTVVTALAGLGLVAAVRQRRGLLLAVPVLLTLAQLTVFYVVARFRLPLLLGLLPFAGLGLRCLLRWAATRRWRSLAIGLLGVGGIAAGLLRPHELGAGLVGVPAHLTAHDAYYEPRWKAAADRGAWARGATLMRAAIAHRPEFLDGIRSGTVLTRRHRYIVCELYITYYGQLGLALRKLDHPGAAAATARAQELFGVLKATRASSPAKKPR